MWKIVLFYKINYFFIFSVLFKKFRPECGVEFIGALFLKFNPPVIRQSFQMFYAYIPASFSLEEKANFDRCVNFMARMLEKYKEDVLLPEMEQDVEKATAE